MAHIDLLQNDIATNPQSGYYRVYFKSDGFPYYRNNAGTETAFTVGSLSDYVTIATPQTITGAKTFSSAVNLGSLGSTTALTPLAVDASGNVVNGSSLSGGQVDSVVGGTNITITTPGVNPTVNLDASISNAITSNTTNIATNATNIASNDTDIATNATNIATNTTNIATNVTAIATNATDIAANTTLANSKVASVTSGTNVTITGTATNPIINSTSVTPSISLQDAYDDGQDIQTTLGEIVIQAGTAINATPLLNFKNLAGNTTSKIRQDGNFETTAIFLNDSAFANQGLITASSSAITIGSILGAGNLVIDNGANTLRGSGSSLSLGTQLDYINQLYLNTISNASTTGKEMLVIDSTTRKVERADVPSGDAVLANTQTFTGVNTFSNNIITSQLTNFGNYPTGSTAIGNVWRDGDNLKFRDANRTKNLSYNVGTDDGSTITSLTIDIGVYTQFSVRSLVNNLTINAPTDGGSALTASHDGQKLTIRIRDNNISKTLTWNPIFRAIGTTLPTPTSPQKTIYVGCIYNAQYAKWDVVAVSEEA